MTASSLPFDLVLVRHAESEWNAAGFATGWADVGLTEQGREQALAAGRGLAARGTSVDVLYTSTLRRAQETAVHLLETWALPDPPVHALWRLNERHLGQLQGLDKQEIRRRWGNAQRQRWRSDPDALPPPLHPGEPRHPRHDRRFQEIPRKLLPSSERISDLRRRVLACWRGQILPQLRAGRRVAIVAHRDSLRVLIASLEGIDDRDFAEIVVEPGVPRIYLTGAGGPIGAHPVPWQPVRIEA